MANIYPFRALKFCNHLRNNLADILCQPYDVLSNSQRKILAHKSPYNMVHLDLPVGQDKYMNAARHLKKLEKSKILQQDLKDSLYVYEQEFIFEGVKKKIRGIFCTVGLDDVSTKTILSHEKTMVSAKQDRLELMKSTFCNLSSVYCFYDGDNQTNRFINIVSSKNPDVEVKLSDSTVHKLWQCYDESLVSNVISQLKNKKLYIADGHHRYETALKFKEIYPEADRVMMFLADVNQEGLLVLPTHRLLNVTLNDKNLREICGDNFEILNSDMESVRKKLESFSSRKIAAFGLYTVDGLWRIFARKTKSNNVDTAILHDEIINKIHGNVNVIFETDPDKCIKSVENSKTTKSCIFLNPVSVDQIKRIADQGKTMPEKSTYFYPKIITGLVMNRLL